MKRLLTLVLALILTLTMAVPAAGGEPSSVAYLYTFEPGNALEGEGTKTISELLNAIQVRMVRQTGDEENLYRISLISEGREAFVLTAQDTAGGEYGLSCSLLGNNELRCRKDQLASFLKTIVQVLADLGVLKDESLEKVESLASRAGDLLGRLENTDRDDGNLNGIDMTPLLNAMKRYASEATEETLDPDNTEYPGAAMARRYRLTETDLNGLIDYLLGKIRSIPVIQDELHSGRLYIGKQQITDDFVRALFAAMHGNTTMDVYEDGQGQMMGLVLRLPDLHGLAESPELDGLVTDPEFLNLEGLAINIERTGGEGVYLCSRTSIHLLGFGTELVAITLERMAAEKVSMPKAKKVHEVGELDSTELWKVLKSMGNTIAWHGVDFILDLPECIVKLLMAKFKLF